MTLHMSHDIDFGLLAHLNADELKQLLHDEDRVEAMIKDLPKVKDMKAEKDVLLASNKSLADFNLSQQPIIHDTQHQVIQLYKLAQELKTEVQDKKQKLESFKNQISQETVLALLQTATAEAEEETESFAEKFLEGKKSIEEFMDHFIEKRKVAHLRRIKAEKMLEILRNQLHGTPNNVPPRPVRSKPPPPPPRPIPLSAQPTKPLPGLQHYPQCPYPAQNIIPSRPAPLPPNINYGPAIPPYPVTVPTRMPLPQFR